MSSPDRDEPYVGPRPFQSEDAPRFFGRESEAADVVSLALAHRVLLLYAPSGAGKSSLLAARVIPLLASERDALVLGPARVSGTVAAGELDRIENVGVHHLLVSLSIASARANEGALADALEKRLAEHALTTDAPAVLVIDQFEELFTHHPERWRDREAFFKALGLASERLPGLRILLSMREEYLAQLVPFTRHLPDKLRGRYRLERLRRDAAREAIERPLDTTERRFAPGAADVLVQNLLRVSGDDGTTEVEGEFVEPVHLQVVCSQLWSKLPKNVTTIDARSIESVGNVDQALAGYYESCIAKVVDELGIAEDRLRTWFEEALITSEGTRGIVHKGTETTAGLPTRVVEQLENLHIVRAEVRGGATFYELTHDRLLQPIRRSNRAWREARRPRDLDFVGTSLAERAKRWEDGGRDRASFLAANELDLVERWLGGGAAPVLTPAMRDYLAESRLAVARTRADEARAEVETQRRKNLRMLGVTIGALALMGFAIYAGIEAQEARDEAMTQRASAETARETALTASRESEAAREKAENAVMLERARFATTLVGQRGRELDALAQGVGAVMPALARRAQPPREALAALRASARPLATGVPLTTDGAPLAGARIDRSGRRVLGWTSAELRVHDAATGAVLFEREATGGTAWERAEIDDRGDAVLAIALARERSHAGGAMYEQKAVQRPIKSVTNAIWTLFDATSGVVRASRELDNWDEELLAIDFGKRRVWSKDRARVRARSVDTSIPDLGVETASVDGVVVSPNGARAVLRAEDGTDVLFDATSGRKIAAFDKPRVDADPIRLPPCAFSPDSARIARVDELGRSGLRLAVVPAADGVTSRSEHAISFEGQLDERDGLWIGFVDGNDRIAVLLSNPDGCRVVILDAMNGKVLVRTSFDGALTDLPRGSATAVAFDLSGDRDVIVWMLDGGLELPTGIKLASDVDDVIADGERLKFVVLSQAATPWLHWPARSLADDAPIEAILRVAKERFQGRPEHEALVREIDALH